MTADAENTRLNHQLEEARARLSVLTQQLEMAERVHAALRSRIASLERQLERRFALDADGEPVGAPGLSAESATGLGAAAAGLLPGHGGGSADEHESDPADYGFGEHDDDLLPTIEEEPHRGRRHRHP